MKIWSCILECVVLFLLGFGIDGNVQAFERSSNNLLDALKANSNDLDGAIVINTWPFVEATESAWRSLSESNRALDAVEKGCSKCEQLQCDGTVGYGGSPDELGAVSLDASIMDGDTMQAGAVGNLRHVRDAVSAARLVMEHTEHSLLAGLEATKFAHEMGLSLADLNTNHSSNIYVSWKKNHCQPNFRVDVKPNPKHHCGPYYLPKRMESEHTYNPLTMSRRSLSSYVYSNVEPENYNAHDTISMIAKDKFGSMAAACSTNGAKHKVPGRVGDAAIIGGGIYVDSDIGGCGATGNGDIHIRFLPCFHVVQLMREGKSPTQATEIVIKKIASRVESYEGALVALSTNGTHGAAAAGWKNSFSYAYRDGKSHHVKVVKIKTLDLT